MEANTKRKVFELAAENFETDEVKNYFLDMSESVPDYFFTMPASTSGKYHSGQQCEPCGQLVHVFMFQSCLEHLLRLERNKMTIAPDAHTRDLMRCVPLFHDAFKCGDGRSKYTVPNHPVLSAQWVRRSAPKHDITSEDKEIIAGMCEAHSGEWNKDRYGNVLMPKPSNDMQFLIHECDIISSRNDFDYRIPEKLQALMDEIQGVEKARVESVPFTESEPKTVSDKLDAAKASVSEEKPFVMPFGKYKGSTVDDVIKDKNGVDYLNWAVENLQAENVVSEIRKALKAYNKDNKEIER